ncbi:Cytochrome C and Quinol oxidase polypeptide I [Lacunisphaera limnophila]|uniref:Cytochrome C and Quinol oxidase polypeptide I n=1 Tax=Lacunisphaera limnophila TaxID=1838286 RepID=A0A1I7PI62_9BACT|nr:mechanosensitive ion channel family protein [Lacunisphaera limnophila]AOS43320.1 Cytochrome C and Quinol oxidase polypeptide I [Lacunisphaera limnophila]
MPTVHVPAGFSPALANEPPDRVVGSRLAATGARFWFLLAVGSLVLAGLLSLTLVVGRLPFMGWLFTDPLFFKRALVVHVDLAMVVWFQAGAATFLALALGAAIPRVGKVVAGALAFAGVIGLLAGAVMPGAQPVLANYVPVIDHPVFIGGLVCWFAGTGVFFAGALAAPAACPRILPDDALVALRASALANLVALATFIAAWRTTLPGLPAIGYYELLAWGGGHVLQVANVAMMLGLWLMLLHRWSGHTVISPAAIRWLLAALVLPQGVLPLLALAGTSRPAYTETATQLMRWTIFPVVLIVLGLGLRHVGRHWAQRAAAGNWRLVGLAGSATLTVLGFILGSLIRGSSTLVPGHYHCAIGAVTLALMTAAYDFCAATSAGAPPAMRWRRVQLLCFGCGQAVFGLGFALAGAYGLGRKQYGAEQHVRSVGEYLGLGVMGLGGLVAVAGGLLFLAVMLRCIGTWRHRSPQPV